MYIIFNDYPAVSYTQASVTAWLESCLHHLDVSKAKLMYHFITDKELLRINQDYLNHDTYTDIITFDYSTEGQIEAEVFISTQRMEENAALIPQSVENELLRLLIHAVLHCFGFKDSSEDEKRLMRRKENELMELFHVKH